MEKRLIDAYALERALEDTPIRFPTDKYKMLRLIENAPTADAVEVVRCDECIHYKQPEEGDFLGLCTSDILAVSHNGEIYPGRGFFCLYGERKG